MASLLEDLRLVARGWRWTHRPLVPRSAERFLPAPDPKEFPTAWARTPLARAVREGVQRFVLRPLVWTETEPRVEGLDHLEGLRPPVMFVANHASHLDAPLVLCSLPRRWRERTATAAAADYFFDVLWRAAATALVFNAFPIERKGARRGTGTARRLIEERWNLLVFPEGTRSRDGWLQRFRLGPARLAVEYRLPVVPVAIRGAYAAMPRGRGWPRPGRLPVSVRYGPPLHPEEGEDARGLNARLLRALERLWDEDATSWWASLRREAEGKTPSLAGPPAARWRRVWEASRPLPRPRPRPVWEAGESTTRGGGEER
ncbi:MAG TPA: lysophospholipid acyltransferase family protein [Actinomycetota bacterium]|nr:lysophospholipid acyltransferase family protein [Actinomycetota bacterium]